MKKKLAISLSVLTLCFLGACISPESAWVQITLHIRGTVTDATNNKPVIGAQVELYSWEAGISYDCYTDEKGQYSIQSTPVGNKYTWYLQACPRGYLWKSVTVKNIDDWQTIDFQLVPDITY